jgi:hypothetical protein
LKKGAALFLIILFSFNLFGYLLVVDYLQQRATKELEARLDNNQYDDSGLIELKIPVDIPYQTDWSLYQRYDGEVEIGGMLYKFVKRKLSGDTLYLMCIPNTKKMHLKEARDNYFALSNDLTQNKTSNSGKAKISFKNLQTDFDTHSFLANTFFIASKEDKVWAEKSSACLPVSFSLSPEHPPELTL